MAMESSVENEQYIIVSENLSFKEVFHDVAISLGKQLPNKSLKPWMVYIGWLFQTITSFLFGAEKHIRKGDHKNLFKNSLYSNDKITNAFGYKFQPVKEVIEDTALLFLNEKKEI